MEKYKKTCCDVVILFKNIRTCLFARISVRSSHVFTPYYIIKIKASFNSQLLQKKYTFFLKTAVKWGHHCTHVS